MWHCDTVGAINYKSIILWCQHLELEHQTEILKHVKYSLQPDIYFILSSIYLFSIMISQHEEVRR